MSGCSNEKHLASGLHSEIIQKISAHHFSAFMHILCTFGAFISSSNMVRKGAHFLFQNGFKLFTSEKNLDN